jgi:hypothetical protein
MIPAMKMLNELGEHGLNGVDREHIIFIAKSVWYYDLIPDLGQISGPFRNDVGYLIDCLARFNVLPKQRKLELISAMERYKPLLPAVESRCHDPRARAWGASCDIMPFMADILPFQTRHCASGWGW